MQGNCSENLGKILNGLSANPTKWSNTLRQFVGLAFKGLKKSFEVVHF